MLREPNRGVGCGMWRGKWADEILTEHFQRERLFERFFVVLAHHRVVSLALEYLGVLVPGRRENQLAERVKGAICLYRLWVVRRRRRTLTRSQHMIFKLFQGRFVCLKFGSAPCHSRRSSTRRKAPRTTRTTARDRRAWYLRRRDVL